jgi:hypothetical protein
MHFDEVSHRFEPLLPGLKPTSFVFSHDGEQVAFTHDGTLWRGRSDGSEQHPLASGFVSIKNIAWSSDANGSCLVPVRRRTRRGDFLSCRQTEARQQS